MAAAKKQESLTQRLKKKLEPYYGRDAANDRVSNPAIPTNALEIYDFPSDIEYVWVPAPGGTAPTMHNVAEMANLRSYFIQKGWQFYPADELAHNEDSDLPWMPNWEDDNGKVRALDNWLMYADKDIEGRRRRDNTARWNANLEGAKESRREQAKDSKDVTTFVESKRGQTSVLDLLREGEE